MNTSGEVADQVVRLSLEGVEMAARITGTGAKELAVMLYSVLKDQQKTKGKTRLQSMLKSGKELKVFVIKDDDMQKFTEEAKRYGVLYCVLRDKDAADGLSDIMVRAEDAAKINRIFEKFKLATVDTASIRSDIERSRAAKKPPEQMPVEQDYPEISKEDRLLDELMAKPAQRGRGQTENPTKAQTIKSHRSEPTSKNSSEFDKGTFEREWSRPSVRKELEKIKADKSRKASSKKAVSKEMDGNRNIAPASRKKTTKKAKEKG